MIKRVISAGIAVAILLAVVLLKNNIVFSVATAIVSLIALGEYFYAIKQKGAKPLETIGYLFCILLAFVGNLISDKLLIPILIMAFPILFIIMSTIVVFSNLKVTYKDVAETFFGIIYIPLMLMFLILTWNLNNGFLLVWFIFGGAWVTDTFAYLIGVTIGKHKFSKISPNKSIEGCIAGLLGSAIFFGIYSHYLNTNFDTELNVVLMTIIGVLVSFVSQIGDFMASGIKRICDVKDFGTIMPGHGGVLDRFDSLIMISPIIYLLFQFII